MSSDCVTIYTDRNFKGGSVQLGPGDYNVNFAEVGNDTVSSIRIPPGWSVSVWEHVDFNGASATFASDSPDLGTFDNKISSITVRGGAPKRLGVLSSSLLEDSTLLGDLTGFGTGVLK